MKGLLYCSLTVAVYLIAWKLQNRFKHSLLNPVLISILVLAGILLAGNIPYSDYEQGGNWLSNLLGLAVVALGVPLYQQMRDIHKELPGVILVVFASSLFALISTVILAVMAGADGQVAISLAPKSVTTPIAVMIVDNLNGVPLSCSHCRYSDGPYGRYFWHAIAFFAENHGSQSPWDCYGHRLSCIGYGKNCTKLSAGRRL